MTEGKPFQDARPHIEQILQMYQERAEIQAAELKIAAETGEDATTDLVGLVHASCALSGAIGVKKGWIEDNYRIVLDEDSGLSVNVLYFGMHRSVKFPDKGGRDIDHLPIPRTAEDVANYTGYIMEGIVAATVRNP